ncbi:hypothetical protein SAMN06265222_10232 [Neorhodopirellula lusitana]|uniref:Uncharacterized protein n=1 Tax=Neorhodopirellula lusitana TaxID=445327 RepID=A0ABY1PX72_9BACT|nr:hypothetical protein [Neorhodopirellula lusitana]SMP45929.1 hypothetical protein SAMN06265222_10232 [Neorhodopirellula lusitana]
MNQPQQSTETRKSASKGTALGLLLCTSLATLVTATGCSYYGNALCSAVSPYEQIGCEGITEFKARVRARSIWGSKYAKCYAKHSNVRDIRTGFVDGFVETCMGGSGCPPLFAPNGGCGLGVREPCAAAWFQGYPLGAAAAESCGCGRNLRNGRVNPALFTCQPGCNAGCEVCADPAPCTSCGEPAAACGCGHSHATPAPAIHGSTSSTLPHVAPGETIVPGSIEMQYQEHSPSPSDVMHEAPQAAPVPAPTPDHSAQAEVSSEPALVQLAMPTNWAIIGEEAQATEQPSIYTQPVTMNLSDESISTSKASLVVRPAAIKQAINSH